MTMGPDEIYKCPYCGTLVYQRTIASCNSVEASFYSDGKVTRPYLKEIPRMTRCRQCNNFFFMDSPVARLDETKSNYEDLEEQYKDVMGATQLNTDDYIEALATKAFDKIYDEIHIREKIWQNYNDRIRGDTKAWFDILGTNSDYLDNCRTLIDLLQTWFARIAEYEKARNTSLDDITTDEKIMMAELYRNLGEFEKSIEVLNAIQHEDYLQVKERLLRECEKGNRATVCFNNNN